MTEGQKRKAVTAMDEMSKDGKFQRTESQYRAWVKADGSTDFPAEKDRYVIYYSWACPWACRTLAVRALLGLQDVIETIAVEPIMARTKPDDPEDQHIGWWFSDKRPDTINGCKHIRELYEKVDPQGKTTKFTVPVLFDKKQNKIVSNESSEIIRMLKEFNEFADKSAPFAGVDLYPEDLKKEIDAVNEWVYPMYNNGVYRSGFATSQEAYNEAVKEVWEALDRAEKILSEQRYLAGDRFTEADVRFFVTSVRFDEIYASHFKCTRRISESCPHVFEHLKEILQMPGVRDTVDIDDARTHYTCSHKKINPFSIIPISPFQAFSDKDFPECWYEVHMKPHNRDEKFPVKK
ncbi:Glutathione S-transferase omega-like 2 [Hondaea fermentalgiana]|uniref:Glutathione S-transferase omega-like 2 n=1 Tax=Hondaea fermentalgiana TaxID=2315210 RepID=A0A2R5GCY5_9STRA|nr:Glutathione S-transferase omega-like 2 [Hondaea fermentalgiana]|eukprot:GBG28836.1 Glutathione S-transferase omega-like 2 [Hondaea fermentalgiana]